jgi:regulatory protein
VPDEVVREAVVVVRPEDEERRARELVRRKLRVSTVRETSSVASKLAAMLIRKGYSEGLAWRVVRDELGPGDWTGEIEPCQD